MSEFIDYNKTKEFVREIFEKIGLSPEYAAIVSDNLMAAEARGIKSHGLVQVSKYVEAMKKGVIKTEGVPTIEKEAPSTLLIDGHFLPGAVTGKWAMEKTIVKAKQTGIAVTAVKGGTHFGMAAFYAMYALKEDMIGLAFTNAGTIVAPFGGYGRELGTNPICMAVPAKEEQPIVFDAATSVQAYNKMFFAATEGRNIPFGWALDQNGHPTDDPKEGMAGSLITFGGYKGYGLCMLVNIITGILSGATTVHNEDGSISENPQGIGFNFAAIDISKFHDVEEFKAANDLFIRRIKSSRKLGNEEILVPGEIEFANDRENKEKGIVIYDGVKGKLEETAALLETKIRFKDIVI